MGNVPEAAAVKIFPPLVPLVAILVGVLLQGYLPLKLNLGMPPLIQSSIGWLIVVASVVILGLWSALLFRGSGQSVNPWTATSGIVEKGPYRFSRNPMYLQMPLICFGVSIAFGNMWILLFIPLVVLALIQLAILPEEAYLEAKFGASYQSYRNRVRRWF